MNVEAKLTGMSMTCAPGSLNGTVRANFSVSHLLAAASFSRAVGKLEIDNKGRPFGDFFEDIQSNAIATVLTATAALESYANELFVDHATVFPNQPSRKLEELWDNYEKKKTWWEKFDFALSLLDKGKLDRGRAPYQYVQALTTLRNELIHFKPEWTHDQRVHAKVARLLKDHIERSPFFAPSEPLFPRAWAGHSATKWAVRSVISFIADFEKSAQLQSRLEPY